MVVAGLHWSAFVIGGWLSNSILCSEFGWWQVAPTRDSIRSKSMNLQYHKVLTFSWSKSMESVQDACNRMFGVTDLPDVNGTNNEYGASLGIQDQ